MGTLVELKQRVSSDWTPFERIQLESLMDCLPAKAACDIAFGVSDIGDPWCAVMDEEGEVVLHVARIQGRFFVHSTVEPFVADARDLPSAVAPFVENFKRPTAMVLPLFESIMPLHAFGAFETAAPEDGMGPSWARDADAAAPGGPAAIQALPDVPPEEPAAASMSASEDAPAVAEPAADAPSADAPPPDSGMPAFISHDDLTVTYELFYRGGESIRLDNAAADLVVRAANDEAPAAPLAPVFEEPAADNILHFPTPTVTAPGPDTSATGGFSQQVDDLVRAAAQDDAHPEPEPIQAWDQPPPFDLPGVLPSAEAL